MNLQRFETLREKFEELSFESNFLTINRILYYFSYLGNIFLILFSYFFLKTVTDSIPTMFPGQDVFFAIFIVLFMTGYELFKRFSIEQLFQSWFLTKKISTGLVLGAIVCSTLVAGSFYLSVKGAHRLIDNTKTITLVADSATAVQTKDLKSRYDKDVGLLDRQITDKVSLVNKTVQAAADQARPLKKAEQSNVDKWEQIVASLKQERIALDSTYTAAKQQLQNQTQVSELDKNEGEENSLAFKLLVFFLEALIIAGVGFNGFFNVSSFSEMKNLMRTDKYRKLTTNLNLLKVYYHNGTRREGDPCPPNTRFHSLVKLQGLDVRLQDIASFLDLLSELQIIQTKNKKSKSFVCSYQKAVDLISTHK